MHTPDMTQDNIARIRELFPNCVTEAKDRNGNISLAVDFDALRQELSNSIVEGERERYRLDWPGKKEAMLAANAPIAKTLRPCREESVDFDTTQNLFIEGDNLDALKLLQESYLGKVKMIYIDPPYNTGNDFIYEDDFAENTDEYLERSNQKDETGRLVANTESNGRFHSDWLSMMYPRLKLARNLLTDDGAIFISIDDNESAKLMTICENIFGSNSFVGQFSWRKRTAKSDVPFGVSQDCEKILCFVKTDKAFLALPGGTRRYFETDDFPERPWRVHDLTKQTTASERQNSYFTIVNPKNGKEYPANPNRTWAVTRETFEEYYKQGKIVFPGDYDFLSISKPAFRYFKDEDKAKAGERFGFIPVSTFLPESVGMTKEGTEDIVSLFDRKVFTFPKPVSLIHFLIQAMTAISPCSSSLILDFFAGSSTTAHAVMQLNAEDGGNRRFIMVQLPEVCDEKSEAAKAGYKTIAEISKERIRRAGKKIKEEMAAKQTSASSTGQGSLLDAAKLVASSLDTGFRVLKVDSSNMADVFYNPDAVSQKTLMEDVSNIKYDRSPEDLLFQVLLDWGVDLSLPIRRVKRQGKTVFFVDENALVACFDKNITEELVQELAKLQPVRAVFRDDGFASDAVKINVEQIFRLLSPGTLVKTL